MSEEQARFLELFLSGDSRTLENIAEIVRKVIGAARYRIPSDIQRDLVQHSLLQIWQTAGSQGFAVGRSFEAFVRTIAHRRCIDWKRQQRQETGLVEAVLADPGRSPEAAYLDAERRRLAAQVLEGLPPNCRALIQSRAVEELTYGEIARRLGRSEGALRVEMCECLERAKRILVTLLRRPDRAEPAGGAR